MSFLKTAPVAAKPEQATSDSWSQLVATYGLQPKDMRYFIHGTTLAVKTIIRRQERGPYCSLPRVP